MKDKILIVVPDRTRKAHLKKILPPLLKLFEQQGLGKDKIEIVVALGLHEPLNQEQLSDLLGKNIVQTYKVFNHSQKNKNLVYLGKTKRNIPVFLNKKLVQANSIISVGVVEPHLYAGYSGGVKTVAIGLAGDRTISSTHHPRFLDHPGTALGVVEGNPFQETLWEIVKKLPLKFCINVVNDAEGNLKKIFSGVSKKVFAEAISSAEKLFRKEFPQTVDVVLAKVGYPKEVNVYQASRAFNYILNVPRPIVKKGGYVIVLASLKEGMGKGLGEERFARILKHMKSPQALINKIKKGGCRAGEHRAYMVAKAMTKANLVFVGELAPQVLKGLPFLTFKTIEEALDFVKEKIKKKPEIYVVDQVLSYICQVKKVTSHRSQACPPEFVGGLAKADHQSPHVVSHSETIHGGRPVTGSR